jgi:SAM-dependent methyltransferase
MSRVDFIPYPPTAFPFRDLLVLERLPLTSDDRVCEIGVGSGGTTARLAKICKEVVGFEISSPTVQALRYLEDRHPNLRFVVADVTEPAALAPYAGRFSKLIACDTLEHVRDPAAFFKAAAVLLEKGGSLLVTFPNEPKYRMHGITRFDEPREIEELLAAAGFSEYRVGAANLSGKSKPVAEALGFRPIVLARKVLRRKSRAAAKQNGNHEAAPPPQTFDETHFFKNMDTWRRLSPALNAYWFGVLRLMEARGPAFDIDWTFEDTQFTECQVLILARK